MEDSAPESRPLETPAQLLAWAGGSPLDELDAMHMLCRGNIRLPPHHQVSRAAVRGAGVHRPLCCTSGWIPGLTCLLPCLLLVCHPFSGHVETLGPACWHAMTWRADMERTGLCRWAGTAAQTRSGSRRRSHSGACIMQGSNVNNCAASVLSFAVIEPLCCS